MKADDFIKFKELTKTGFTYAETCFLEECCANKQVLELGTYTGFSTYAISLRASRIITVDLFDENLIKYGSYINDYSIDEIKDIFNLQILPKIKIPTEIVIMDIDKYLLTVKNAQLIFIDSGRGESRAEQFEACLEKTNQILLHDFVFGGIIRGEIDYYAAIISMVWKYRHLYKKLILVGTLLYIEL